MATTTAVVSDAAHAPVGNPRSAGPKRFYSIPPSIGSSEGRANTHSDGYHEVTGFKLAVAAAPLRASRAISELSFAPTPVRGLPLAAIATGASGLVEVTDTTQYPWRATAALKITIPGQGDNFYATGWFIGPYAVITAAHAVYPRMGSSGGQWAKQIEVFPGLNGFESAPPFNSFVSDTFYCPTAWQSDGDPRLDYGVVLLKQDVGSTLGTFGYSTFSDADIRASLANIAGYPVNAPDGTTPQGHLWYGASQVIDVDESFVYYPLDTRDGQSGSCIYRNSGSDSFAMAVHTTAVGAIDHGVRITAPVFSNLQNWASMQG
jgi:glutamyl endopeptidase